jgi:hypothetical protein
MDIRFDLNCQSSTGASESAQFFVIGIEDTGTYIQPVSPLFSNLRTIVPVQCAISASMDRNWDGVVDPNFDQSGRIRAHQERTIRFTFMRQTS